MLRACAVFTVATGILAGHALKPAEPVVIKADLIGPYLYLNAEVNGKPVRLLIDSGAGLNVLSPEAADRLGIQGGTPVNASGAGSASVPARIVTLDSLKIGAAVQNKAPAVVVPLPGILGVDGLVGHGFIDTYVTTFDYEAKTLTFTPPSEFKVPSGFVEKELRIRENIPEVQMTIDGAVNWVKVDTGASDSLTLFDTFVEARDLRSKLKKARSGFGGGVGGMSVSENAKITGLNLAGSELPEMTATLSRLKSGAFADKESAGNLGAGILSRYTMILDYSRRKAYFKPNSSIGAPEKTNRSGLSTDFKNGAHTVLMVAKDSPAEKAGVKAGETIIGLNGKPAGDMHPMEMWSVWRHPAGTKLILKVQTKEGEERLVEITLADY